MERSGLVGVLDERLAEAPANELEVVAGVPGVVTLLMVVSLLCLEDVSRFRGGRDLPPPPVANSRPVRRGVAAPAFRTEAAAAFLAGALDGRSVLEVVPLVCAARISGAISAMSGNEFGAGNSATVRRSPIGSSIPPLLRCCVFSGSRR